MAINFNEIKSALAKAPAVPARLREGFYPAKLIDVKVVPEVVAVEGTAQTGSKGYLLLTWRIDLVPGQHITQTQRLYNYDLTSVVGAGTADERLFMPVSLFIDPIAAHCTTLPNGKTFTLMEACEFAETTPINCEFYRNDRNILVFEPRFPHPVTEEVSTASATVSAVLADVEL